MKDRLLSVNWSSVVTALVVSGIAAYFASWVTLEKAAAVQEVRVATVTDQNQEVLRQLAAIRENVAKLLEYQAQIRERLARVEAMADARAKEARR